MVKCSCKRFIVPLFMLACAIPAFAVDVTTDSVVAATGALTANGNDWTANELVYMSPSSNDSLNREEEGWYAGLRRTWALSYTGTILNIKYTGTKTADTHAAFSDNAGRSVDDYAVARSIIGIMVENSPDGSGIKNEFQLGGTTSYMKYTDWNVWVTPETMHALSLEGKDYVATLTVGGDTYTITVPKTTVLKDGNGKIWYPALALVDGKVYGDMELAVAAGVIAAMGEKGMEFFVEPVGYPDNFSAVKDGDVWKLVFNEPTQITDAAITLSATEVIVRDCDIQIEISSVTLGNATLQEGTDYTVSEDSVFTASTVGEYTVTINGTGNYAGSASATWKIVEPTGEFAEDAMSIRSGDPAYGTIDPANSRRLDITDSVLLVYKNDEFGERWEAAVEIRWPHEVTEYDTYFFQQVATRVQYTDAKHAAVAVGEDEVAYGNEILDGEWYGLSATTNQATYYEIDGFLINPVSYTYFDTLTWTVSIFADDVAAAVESGAENLEFSIVCGSVAWGDETQGDVQGLKDTEFTVSLGLDSIFLLNGDGEQVYPQHTHDWSYSLSDDGVTLTASCAAPGCFLAYTEGSLDLSIVSKDSRNEAYAEGHYRDGVPAEAILEGAEKFALTGATIGEVGYLDEAGATLESAPVEPGRYTAYAVVTEPVPEEGEAESWTLRLEGLEILAGEASMDGIHVKDAATYLERATGDAMEISAGKSYTAAKTYITPERYGILNLQCGRKTYDLAGFTVTAVQDGPLFQNNGKLTIKDSSAGSTGKVSANPGSSDDTVIVNTGDLVIEGGTFTGTIRNEGGSVSISGGRFSVKPDESFIAEGYDIVRRGSYWCVEKHEHHYRLVSLANRVLVATCTKVFADGTLQISHCSGRQLVGVVGIRKFGLLPQIRVDYDRNEHPAEFYAINMSTVASVLSNANLLDMAGAILESDLSNLDAAGILELLTRLSEDEGFSEIITDIFNLFVSAGAFETITGAELGEITYTKDGEPFDGVPVEAGLYTASVTVTTAEGCNLVVKGTYRINEKELPIETEGHSLHIWSFEEDGAKVTATCPGNVLRSIKCNASPMGIELVPSVEGGRKVFDATPLEVAVSNLNTFVINTGATVSDIVYTASDGTESAEAPIDPGEYTASVTVQKDGILLGGTYTASIPLVIEEKAPESCFPFPEATIRLRMDSCALIEKDGDLFFPLCVPWPHMVEQIIHTPRFTDPAHAAVTISTTDKTFTAVEILAGEAEEWGLMADAGEFFRLRKLKCQTYMTGVSWMVPFTRADIEAACSSGSREIVRTITLEGKCWEDDMIGLKPATITVILEIDVDFYWIRYLGNGSDSGEMDVEMRFVTPAQRLSDCAFKKKNFNHLGWSFNEEAEGLADLDFADRQFVSDEFELGVTNDLFAVWTTNVVVSGDIEGEEFESISSIVAWGVGSTIEDAIQGRVFGSSSPWRYVCELPSAGAYDVVVQAVGGKGDVTTITTLVFADNDPDTERKGEKTIEDPGGDRSSVVDNSAAGDYPAVAGGIDDIARKAVNPGERGKSIEIRFTVKDMPAADTTRGYSRIRDAVTAGHVKPLDFTLAKYVDGVFSTNIHDLSLFNGLVESVMPFTLGGRRNFRVARYHEEVEGDPATGSVAVLPEGVANANELGECFNVNEETGELVIRCAKLSTYALVWDGAVVTLDSLEWNVDWLSGMYVPEIALEVKDGDGWAGTVTNMCFLLEKRDGIQLWDAKANKAVSTVETIDGVEFFKVPLKDRFAENGLEGPDSGVWGAAWFDSVWVNAALSEILLYAPSYWPRNPKDVPELDNLVAYVRYESCECTSFVEVVANTPLLNSLSAVSLKSASKPLAVANLNASLAVGAAVTESSEPYLKLADFLVEDGTISGTVEIGAGSERGSLGAGSSIVLWGAKSLGEEFAEISTVECDEDGSFSAEVPEGYSFFKVKLSIADSVK